MQGGKRINTDTGIPTEVGSVVYCLQERTLVSLGENYGENTVCLPRQHLTKWSKTQYLCGIAATGAGLLSTFYQH